MLITFTSESFPVFRLSLIVTFSSFFKTPKIIVFEIVDLSSNLSV